MIGQWRGLLLAQAFLVSAAFGDDAVTLQILSPSVRVTAGDTITLTAVGVTATGTILPEPNASWSVDQQGAATIDYFGHLTGVTLGIATVSAYSGSLRHDILIQVVPDHTIIRPALAKLQIGEQRQFTATAYDKQGRPIPGVPFSWAITSSNNDGTPNVPYATISQTGLLTGGYEGTAYVRAMYTYQTLLAGMEARVPVYASFVVSAPRPFRVTRLLNASTQTRQNPHLRPRPSPLWTTPDGSVLFNASLDGAGTALLAWNNGGFHSVISAGTGSKAPGSLVTDLGVHSVTADGTLMLNQLATDGGVVQLGQDGQLQPLLVTNTSGAGVESLSGFSLTRNSRSSNGYFVFNGGYRVPGTSQYTNGLFRGVGNSVTEVLASQLDHLPELSFSGAGISNYGVDNNGVAWYLANGGPSQQVIYRHDATGRQKFLALGDAFQGSTVLGFYGQRNSTPGFLFAENGDVLLSVALQDGRNFVTRYTGSDASQPAALLRTNNNAAILGYRSDGTALIYGNPYPNKGDGAWLWNGDSLQPVALIGKALVNGEPIQSIESGAIDANGQITLMVATADYPMVVVRAAVGGNPQLLFQAGDPVAVPVPNVIEGFVPDGRTGNPLLMVGSITNAAVAEWRDSDIQPLLSPGDRILGAPPFPGLNPYGYAQRTANGDLYIIISSVGVARYSGGQWSTALKFPIKLDDGATSNNLPYRIAVNNAGAIAWISGTNKQDTRVYLSQNGQNQLVCQTGAAIAGETVFACDGFYVDDLNRVILQARMQNDPVDRTYVWNQGAWQLAVKPYQTQIAGRTVNYINSIHPMGSHCFAVLGTDVGSYVVEWGNSGFTVVYGPNDTMPTGFPLNNVNFLEANPNGDIAFISQAYPSQAVYFRRNGVLSTVLTTGRPTEAGDLLVAILGLDLSQDGTVYLLGINQNDELVFYSAAPL